MSMYCPNCFKRHGYIETICSHCGVKLKRICPKWDFFKTAVLQIMTHTNIKRIVKKYV